MKHLLNDSAEIEFQVSDEMTSGFVSFILPFIERGDRPDELSSQVFWHMNCVMNEGIESPSGFPMMTELYTDYIAEGFHEREFIILVNALFDQALQEIM